MTYKPLDTQPELSPRRQRMLELYRALSPLRKRTVKFLKENGGDLKQAVIDAGYSVHSAAQTVSAMKNDPLMQEYMSLMDQELLDNLIEDKTVTVNEIRNLALSNMSDYIDSKTNKFIGIKHLTREQAAAISEVIFDSTTGKAIKIKLYDKRLSLQLLAQIQQLLKVEDEAVDDTAVIERIRKAQQRIKPPAHLADEKKRNLKLRKTG
jgi:uncharacterized protein (UPF0147 family)